MIQTHTYIMWMPDCDRSSLCCMRRHRRNASRRRIRNIPVDNRWKNDVYDFDDSDDDDGDDDDVIDNIRHNGKFTSTVVDRYVKPVDWHAGLELSEIQVNHYF
ncbi:hypothetical protein CRM22_007416 [Opisthorchis felineus]|uniref:Uncharacterized protein n=1 Tax=Opisthorchis felineus TaxID=147828 RepID=A0A4S2LFZ9_OPIFE|nr:hypothetical protein CRM22_007416 [Opisthorchis felineus]